jgi:hypothetical protein
VAFSVVEMLASLAVPLPVLVACSVLQVQQVVRVRLAVSLLGGSLAALLRALAALLAQAAFSVVQTLPALVVDWLQVAAACSAVQTP